MEWFLDDGDVKLAHGDALTRAWQRCPASRSSASLPALHSGEWGLRDYGTGSWNGGDADCDHLLDEPDRTRDLGRDRAASGGTFHGSPIVGQSTRAYKDACGRCGATRVDQQIGLEETPDEWCARLVAVFREARRVLRNDGVCFIEIGDSYASAALRGAEPSGTTCTPPRGSQDLDSACLDPGDARAASPSLRNQHTDQPHLEPLAHLEPTSRDRSHSDSAAVDGCAEPLGAQASTAHAGASARPPASSASASALPQSPLTRPATSELDAPHRGHTDASNLGTSGTSDPSVGRTQGTALLRMASQNHTSASLKQKDLVGAPWMLAFALRADGWYLRAEIIWSKPNPMPESVTDRPTKAHSTIFLLTKSKTYAYDADAIREVLQPGTISHSERYDLSLRKGLDASHGDRGDRMTYSAPSAGRNARSVWSIATEPTPFAHFATFPQALVERCVKAGTSEHGCCGECGAPWRRITESSIDFKDRESYGTNRYAPYGSINRNGTKSVTTTGWEPSCACASCFACDGQGDVLVDAERLPCGQCGGTGLDPPPVVPCVVLDPFMGSGTTALVARRLGRHAIGIELNAEYLAIAATRLQQLPLPLFGGHA